jgi:deazaflavin-dependent oxidoreductase (nitroreductase family)
MMADFLKIADRSWPLLLDHIGARSGKLRNTPLIYMPDGDGIVIVAAKGGHPENPSWLYNLRACPDTEIQIGSRRMRVRAREADAEERHRLWPAAAAYNSDWRHYQSRTARQIPVVILEPRS